MVYAVGRVRGIAGQVAGRWDALDEAWKFALASYILARLALSAWSLVILFLFPVVVQNLDLFGTPVLAVFDTASGSRYVFSRRFDSRTLTFAKAGTASIQDSQTGTVWSFQGGKAISGHYLGYSLAAPAYSAEDVFPYHGVEPETNPLLSVWQRFDTNWYLSIAARGYGVISGDDHFPPVYPILIRVVGNSYPAALLISNVAMIGALALLFQMARALLGPSIAARTVAYLLLFPTAFFLSCAYTESLFLMTALLAIRDVERRAWLWAGFWGFCSVLIRLQGIALVVPLAYALWTAKPRASKLARITALALPALAASVYLLIRAVAGDPQILPMAETTLSARLSPPWENYIYSLQTMTSGRASIPDLVNLIITSIFVVALLIGWRKLPIAWRLYSGASLVILTLRLVDTQPLNSMSRYVLTLFPVFVLFADWGKNVWFARLFVYSAFALSLFLSAQFMLWGWVG